MQPEKRYINTYTNNSNSTNMNNNSLNKIHTCRHACMYTSKEREREKAKWKLAEATIIAHVGAMRNSLYLSISSDGWQQTIHNCMQESKIPTHMKSFI